MRNWFSPDPQFPSWQVAITGRQEGNVSFRYGGADEVRHARQEALKQLGLMPDRVLSLSLDVLYGVHWLDAIPESQGVLVQQGFPSEGAWLPHRLAAIFLITADCFPLVVFDPDGKRFGIFHAGRPELMAGLLTSYLDLGRKHAINFTNLRVFLGPGICTKHYVFESLPREILTSEYQSYIEKSRGIFRVNLKSAIFDELLSFGVQPGHIRSDDRCTYETPELFSHRETKGLDEARFATLTRVV